jgi:hypothetical protein
MRSDGSKNLGLYRKIGRIAAGVGQPPVFSFLGTDTPKQHSTISSDSTGSRNAPVQEDTMPGTATRHKTGPARAEFSDDVHESVETVRIAAIEAPCRAG